MIKINFKKGLFLFLMMFPILSFAAVPSWQILSGESSLSFTATQNGAPVSGKFKTFTGVINFDPDQLSASSVVITIDMNSVTDPYAQLSDTLKTPDWFNVKLFPDATFKCNNFVKTGDKTYQAKGTLTIRDKTAPVMLNFTQEAYTPTMARIKGSTTFKRTTFGVGQGEWADTSTVKDDVTVDFTISATKK